jgi:hypothetical protein
MIVVGQISTLEEAKEIEYIRRLALVGNRARTLALKTREE